jgi:hypothetical protein
MPVVKLSISEGFEPKFCFVGKLVLLVLVGTSTVPSFPSDDRPFSASGDFRRTGVGLEPSARGWAGVLVFFTTTGGADCSRELVADPGRGPEDVLGLEEKPVVPLDGDLVCPFVGNGGAVDTADPLSDVALRRRVDCLVGCE